MMYLLIYMIFFLALLHNWDETTYIEGQNDINYPKCNQSYQII